MISPKELKAILNLWMDRVADAVLIGLDRLGPSRRLRLIEQDDGSFQIEAFARTVAKTAQTANVRLENMPSDVAALIGGASAELVLHSKHFLFRSLELPRRASEFLDGIVRTQIDRLTPWSAQDAAFGYATAADPTNERIELTIAATARSLILPYLQTLSAAGAQSVFASAQFATPNANVGSIKLFEPSEKIGGASRSRVRRVLFLTLLATAATTAVTVAATAILSDIIQNKQAEITQHIADQRAAILASRGASTGPINSQRALEQRKRETPSSVISIEALSHALPDDTYLTELRIEGNKLQMVGMTRNAPALISLMEKSSQFDHATFFAPTTQAPDDSRQQFHIESKIKSGFTSLHERS